jgi:hypothetical protein
VNAAAFRPRDLPWSDIEAAIRFEFDLPYPGDRSLGMVSDAIEAFRQRRQLLGRPTA